MPRDLAFAGFFLTLNLAAPPLSAADGFKAMAKELSRSARRAGISRVAILPLAPADGSDTKAGWTISEKLTTQFVRLGQVQTVERSLLRTLMEEHHLARTGMIDPTAIMKLGKVFSVEGVVAGSFVTLGREAVVNARIINVETGLIVAAVERRIARDWLADSSLLDGRLAAIWVPAQEFTVEPPPLPARGFPELRDAPAETSCENAPERVDHLESQILDLKARYWALELKKGVSLTTIKVNPGSTISDPVLKKRFYERMKYWYGLDAVPPLTPSEVRSFVAIDGAAYSLYRECGV